MTHVLVTGGAGFIASHLVDAYLERGWRVSVIDDLSTGDRRNVNRKAEFHHADVRDGGTAALVAKIRPDVISHHAAQVDVRVSVADPASDAEVNVVGTLRLLQAAVAGNVKRFIFASSGGAIYGEPVRVPQDEDHPARPLSPYGCAKLAVENYMVAFREMHGLSTVALRYANVYGPRQSARGEAGVIAIFANRMLRGEPVTINGTGEQTRDFVFVGDIVRANMAVSDAGDPAGAFNVGTGVETSINRIYEVMARQTGVTAPPKYAPGKRGEQIRSVLDGSRLAVQASLGEKVALESGLKQTMDWFRAQR